MQKREDERRGRMSIKNKDEQRERHSREGVRTERMDERRGRMSGEEG